MDVERQGLCPNPNISLAGRQSRVMAVYFYVEKRLEQIHVKVCFERKNDVI